MSFIPAVLSRARQRSQSPLPAEADEADVQVTEDAVGEDGSKIGQSLKAWTASLKAYTLSAKSPSILVVCHESAQTAKSEKRNSIREKVCAANRGWLELCEYEESQVVGRSFAEIPGFQGPLTSEQSKLQFGCLLLKEESRVEGLKVVNYRGRSKQPIEIKLNIDILRCGARNLAFLCTIVEHTCVAGALPRARAAVGSAGRAVVALRATSAKCLQAVTPGAVNSPDRPRSAPWDQVTARRSSGSSGDPAEPAEPAKELPGLWKHLLAGHSHETTPGRVQQDGHETCSICLERWAPSDCVRGLSCGHAFHKDCIDAWFAQQISEGSNGWLPAAFMSSAPKDFSSPLACPMCRKDPTTCCPRYEEPGQQAPAEPPRARWSPSHKGARACMSLLAPSAPAAPAVLPTTRSKSLMGGRSYCKARSGMAEMDPEAPNAVSSSSSSGSQEGCGSERPRSKSTVARTWQRADLVPQPPSSPPVRQPSKRPRSSAQQGSFDGVCCG